MTFRAGRAGDAHPVGMTFLELPLHLTAALAHSDNKLAMHDMAGSTGHCQITMKFIGFGATCPRFD